MGMNLPNSLRLSIKTNMRPVERSPLEKKFIELWRLNRGPELVEEFRFHPVRRWRADFAHVPTRTLIEIEGGTWKLGRHNRGGGYDKDCEKYNAAQCEGYKVFRLTHTLVRTKDILPILADIARREGR